MTPLMLINQRRISTLVCLAILLVAEGFQNPLAAQDQSVGVTDGAVADSPRLRDLDLSDADLGSDVEFQGTVTYWDPLRTFVFVQDGDAAVFVTGSNPKELEAGALIRVQGALEKGDLQKSVAAKSVTVLRNDSPPEARFVDLERLEFGDFDGRFVEVEGVVTQVQVQSQFTRLFLQTPLQEIEFLGHVRHQSSQLANDSQLVGKRIRLKGCLGVYFDEADYIEQNKPGERVIAGFQLFCNSSSPSLIHRVDTTTDLELPPNVIDLAQLESDDFPSGPFTTHGQVSLINYATEPRELVLFDESNSIRTQVRYTNGIEPGMILRISGFKQRNPNGTYRLTTTYSQQLNLTPLLPPSLTPFAKSISEYEPDRRIMIRCRPREIICGDSMFTAYLTCLLYTSDAADE